MPAAANFGSVSGSNTHLKLLLQPQHCRHRRHDALHRGHRHDGCREASFLTAVASTYGSTAAARQRADRHYSVHLKTTQARDSLDDHGARTVHRGLTTRKHT